MDSIAEKINSLENELNVRENRFKQEILERNIEEKDNQIRKLIQ